jgi:hypothetical protein
VLPAGEASFRVSERVEVHLGRCEQGGDLRPFERDRGTLRIVLVVPSCVVGPLHDVGEVPAQCSQPRGRAAAIVDERGQHRIIAVSVWIGVRGHVLDNPPAPRDVPRLRPG